MWGRPFLHTSRQGSALSRWIRKTPEAFKTTSHSSANRTSPWLLWQPQWHANWNSMCCYHGNVLCSMATKDFWCTCSHTVCARSCLTAADSLRLNQQEWFLLFKFPPLLLRKVTLQHPLTEMSEHRGCKGMCPTVEPYFPALDSATAVRFAPVCPAVLIMLDLGSEEFTLRLSEYLQIRRSAVNSAFFFSDMISICQRVGVSGSHVTFIPLWPAAALASTSVSHTEKTESCSRCRNSHLAAKLNTPVAQRHLLIIVAKF